MPLVLQKFGGSSVADPGKVQAAARRAIEAHRQGSQVVVVVSARGDATDDLIKMARQVTERPSMRELDMLLSTGEQVSVALMAMAIEAMGVPAISFTGAQIGIVTDSFHTKARIRNISTERIFQALDEGKIAVVAGFQGVDQHAEITTLGRGGSDTTAVALAAVLRADACEIYTDVDGIATTDPRIVPEARQMDRISYDEMLELASLGAGVMHSRSIEFAKKHDVPIHVRSAFSDSPGTWIVADGDARRLGWSVTGAALVEDEARITVLGVPDDPDSLHRLFRRVAESNASIDMILKNVMREGAAKVSFTVSAADLHEALQAATDAAREIGATGVVRDGKVAKVSVVGLGMRTHFGVAATMLEALAQEEISVQMITTGDIKISVLVDRPQASGALRAVHRAFGLDVSIDDVAARFEPGHHSKQNGRRTQGETGRRAVTPSTRQTAPTVGLEDLVISTVELDDRQGRVTILGLSDRPGCAFHDGEVDLGSVGRAADWQVEQGIRLLCPTGTTGEGPTLTPREHGRVIETVVEHSARRARVLAGAGSCSTAEAVRLTRIAAEAGADGALVVAPYYNRPAQDGLYAHFSRLADASPIPLVLYNVPARTGCSLEPQTIERLAHHERIVAIKEASGSLDQASEIILRNDLTVLCGNDSLTLPMLALGAQGVISVAANLVPKEIIALVEAAQQTDLTRARRIHNHLFPLCQALMNLAPNPVAVKTALALIGQGNGELRLPLTPPELRIREKISVALSLHGLRVQESGAGA